VTDDRPLRADARRNRERLLAAADHAFRRHGVNASLDDIARAAGVGIGTLYRHFPTRDDLILALVAADLDRVAALADEYADRTDALERWLDELVRHTIAYRGLAEAVVAATDSPTALGACCDRVHGAGARLVRREQQRGTLRSDADPDDVIDLANAIAWLTEGERSPRRRRRLLRLAIDGLRATAA
jgi:AcrR family transcriptional regulator